MRSALTTACEVIGAGCIGFAFGVMPGLIVSGVALVAAGVVEGRRS